MFKVTKVMLALSVCVSIVWGAKLKIQPRIAHGQQSERGRFPFYVYLESGLTVGCGGTLIDNFWILTAAHCVHGLEKNIRVHFGLSEIANRDEPTRMTLDISPDSIHIHPDFSAENLKNDIALIEVEEPYKFNQFIQPISIAVCDDETVFREPLNGIIVGGGFRASSFDFPDYLQWGSLRTTSKQKCMETFPEMGNRDSVFCASGFSSICVGESGGGLLTNDFRLIGIASFVKPDPGCEYGEPHAFTNVNFYRDWIIETTGILFEEC